MIMACLGGAHPDAGRGQNELARYAETKEEVEARSAEYPTFARVT